MQQESPELIKGLFTRGLDGKVAQTNEPPDNTSNDMLPGKREEDLDASLKGPSFVVIRGAVPLEAITQLLDELPDLSWHTAEFGRPEKSGRAGYLSWLKTKHWFQYVLYGIGVTSVGWWPELKPVGFRVQNNESVQIAAYNSESFFNRHRDAGGVYGDRQLSLVCELQSADGAGLIVNDTELMMSPGDVAVFPSCRWHTATPAITGNRLSATLWINAAS